MLRKIIGSRFQKHLFLTLHTLVQFFNNLPCRNEIFNQLSVDANLGITYSPEEVMRHILYLYK